MPCAIEYKAYQYAEIHFFFVLTQFKNNLFLSAFQKKGTSKKPLYLAELVSVSLAKIHFTK